MRRPDTIIVKRRDLSGRSATGSQQATTDTIHTGLPATVQDAPRADLRFEPEAGKSFMQDALLVADGLGKADYAGVAAGGTLVVNGITYTVMANGLGAFPDIRANDRVERDNGEVYLVLAVAGPFTVTRTIQARLAKGKAWPA